MEEIPLEGQRDFEQSDDGIAQTASVLKRNGEKKKRLLTTVDILSACCFFLKKFMNKQKI